MNPELSKKILEVARRQQAELDAGEGGPSTKHVQLSAVLKGFILPLLQYIFITSLQNRSNLLFKV